MSRRHAAEKRDILPDPKFGDRLISKFMNNMMTDGKKSVAERIVYPRSPGREQAEAVPRSRCFTRRSTM